MLHEMKIGGLAMDPSTNAPILILNSIKDDFSIPIWIGLLEAAAIASVLQNITFDRPMTHDLFRNFIEKANINIPRIEVYDLKNNTFYAKIHCQSPDETFVMDARPSDAIALALRVNAAIYVDDKVIENLKVKDGQTNGEYESVDESDQGKQWEDYLKNLSADDFGKYKV